MKSASLIALTLALGCGCTPGKQARSPPLDECQAFDSLVLTAIPLLVRVNGPVLLEAQGGSGHYIFSVASGGSGGEVREGRFVAGPTPGNDTITVIDDCGNSATAVVEVRGAFFVAPTRATIKPATRFQVTVTGALGPVTFVAQSLGSQGGVSADGQYTAGPQDGLDLIVVQDASTGEQVLLQYQVSAGAHFRAAPSILAVPAGAQAPLMVADGSGHVSWRKISGPGSITAHTFITAPGDTGTALLEGTDDYTQESTSASVRVLETLARTGRPHGRLSDQASMVTGDFDGDGFADVAIGVAESDLAFPLGGAVFIYRGAAAGLPASPTWTILGQSDTAQLGAVLAAGDLDGDGKDDLALSAPGADITGADSGAVLLYHLTSEGPRLMRDVLSGISRGANFGASLAIADIDDDGTQDLIVGSPGADLVPAQASSRGVIDVFLGHHDGSIADQSAFRLGGWDLARDGTFKATNNARFGRSLAVGDFNNDGRVDLAFNGSASAFLDDGGISNRNQSSVAVHFGRESGLRFVEKPDLFLLPSNLADLDEGTLRLGYVPSEANRPAMLLTALDRADSPNLSTQDGGIGGANGGGVYLFDLSSRGPTSPTAPETMQYGDAFARFYGETSGIQMGRSFALAEVQTGAGLSLVLGAPYANMGTSPNAGKLMVFPLSSLGAGTVMNKPLDFRPGGRADVLGTAVAAWRFSDVPALVTLASRATTTEGDFTGRVDAFVGTGLLSTWAVSSSPIPARLAAEQFGVTIKTATIAGKARAFVGAPFFSGPDPNNFGSDTTVGQAMVYELGSGSTPLVLHEGAVTPYARDGRLFFGGRFSAADLALTDFDGDGRKDLAIATPGLLTPLPTSIEYAQLPLDGGCTMSPAKALGGVSVQLAQADGTFREGYRLWAPEILSDCDAGNCARAAMGRTGIAGGFDFNNDGIEDVAITRTAGLEIIGGLVPLDKSLSKLTAVCQPLFSLPPQAQGLFGPVGLGDLDGDGCDEVAVRYGALNTALVDPLVTPLGVVIVFGSSPKGACGAHTKSVYIRLSGEPEVGISSMQLGNSVAPVGRVLGDTRDFIAIGARLYPFQGVTQPSVLLYDRAQLGALRSSTSGTVVPALGGELTPLPVVYKERAPLFGRAVAGNVDLTGDGVVDLLVGAPRANLNGEGTGAVFVFAGGAQLSGARESAMTFFGDHHERGNFGQELSLSSSPGPLKALLGIGAPLSYRTGTANGAAFITSFDF